MIFNKPFSNAQLFERFNTSPEAGFARAPEAGFARAPEAGFARAPEYRS